MHGPAYRRQAAVSAALAGFLCLSLSSCRLSQASGEPSIEFSRVPAAGDGRPDALEPIEGRVKGARPGQRIVLFALSGVWWVQPLADQPFTAIQSDSTWRSSTHPGSNYAALLVDSRFHPPLTVEALPEKGGPVLAVATAKGALPSSSPVTLQFSGYPWEVRQAASDHGGQRNSYNPANAWTDQQGFLHLRVSRQNGQWVSAEVKLARSLGYGSYRFVVHDVSHLEPAAVFALFTWDESGPAREMDIEISRWGELEGKNAQYVVQPYVVPANTVRFTTPPGALTHWMSWEPGRVLFKTVRGSSSNMELPAVADHVFTSGVPSPGNERIHMSMYVFDGGRNPLQNEFEVMVEKFEFRP